VKKDQLLAAAVLVVIGALAAALYKAVTVLRSVPVRIFDTLVLVTGFAINIGTVDRVTMRCQVTAALSLC
jgi:hypothetical protein